MKISEGGLIALVAAITGLAILVTALVQNGCG